MTEERTVTVAVQVLPLAVDVIGIVDQAIQVIADSGVRYEVEPMETVMEGQLDRLLEIAKSAHLACFDSGAQQVVTIIKIADALGGSSIDEKVAKYR